MRFWTSSSPGRRPFGLLLFVAAVLALLAGAAAPAYAANTFGQLKALIEDGHYAEARDFAAHASKSPELNKLNLAFTDALILKVEGRYAEAAAAMRAILSDHPNLTRVRGELADTLLHMGDTEGATFNFELLANAAADTGQRNFYESYLTAIRRKRPWTLDAYVALAPSTNINNGISGSTVIIGGVPFDASSHAGESGVGLSYGVAGTYRFDLAPGWDFTLGARTNGSLYLDHAFDKDGVSAFGELARTAGDWRVGVSLAADRTWIGWDGFNWDIGPQLSVSRTFGAAGTLIGTAGWKALSYDQTPAYNGGETDLGLRYLKSFGPAANVGVGFLYSGVDAQVAANAYDRYRPSLDFYKELPHGLLANISLAYERRQYRGDFFLMGTPRVDDEIDASVGVTLRGVSWHGFAPKIEYTFSRNESNVALYRYTSHAIGFYLTRKY